MIKPEGIVLDCTAEEAWGYQAERLVRDPDLSTYDLPQLPGDVSQVHYRLRQAEWELIASNYADGSATHDNDTLSIDGTNGVLLTAEHATRHRRPNDHGEIFTKLSDVGTGALCLVASLDTGSTGLIAVGRQTGDANRDAKHPFKDIMANIVAQPESNAHISIHGMRRGLASGIRDGRGFNVILGIGDKPSEATKALTDLMVETAADYDLRIGINQTFIDYDKANKRLKFNDDGTIMTNVFRAPDYTTSGYSRAVAQQMGKGDSFAAVEVELSGVLRPRRNPVDDFPTQRDH